MSGSRLKKAVQRSYMESRTFLNYVGTGNKFSLKIKGPGDPKFVIGYCACLHFVNMEHGYEVYFFLLHTAL